MLTVHHILPRYIFKEIVTVDRNYFLNGKNSYALCNDCHSKYENKATLLRVNLLYKFHYQKQREIRFIKDENLVKIKNLCRYMCGFYCHNNYNYSIYQAYDFVKKFYNKKYLAYDEILQLASMRDVIQNPNYVDYGSFLIAHIGVRELDTLYRKNFIEFLQKHNVDEENLITETNEYYENK